jgi:hypothetical protein
MHVGSYLNTLQFVMGKSAPFGVSEFTVPKVEVSISAFGCWFLIPNNCNIYGKDLSSHGPDFLLLSLPPFFFYKY